MARVGINPARGKTTNRLPARVTVAVLTYIPDLTGYFEHRLNILKLVLASLKAHTKPSHDILIFDNGSCSTVVDYLLELLNAGELDYLFLSQKNIGKIDSLRFIFNAAPGEIIAYSDDDILFYPGWLEAHLQILNQFPRTGMVSGAPVRDAARHARKSLEALVDQGSPELRTTWERRIPDEWEMDWAISTGRDPKDHLQSTKDLLDLVLHTPRSNDPASCEAIGSANHFQFVTPKSVILQALPEEWTGKLMGSMIELDEAVDRLGYLRLSTVDRYTRHLGNVLSDDELQQAQTLGLLSNIGFSEQTTAVTPRDSKKAHWLLRIPGSRRILSSTYNRLFKILYP